MILFHPIEIGFPSYCTYAAYLSNVTVQPTSYRGDRLSRLFRSPGSVLDFLALAGSLPWILR